MTQPAFQKRSALTLWDQACAESKTLLGAAMICGGGGSVSDATRGCAYNHKTAQARREATARFLRALADAIAYDPRGDEEGGA